MIDFEKKCIICGNDLDVVEEKTVCPHCHFAEQNSVSKTDMALLSESFAMLENKDFDSAYNGFGKFVRKHADLSVGYFGLVLSKYYVTSHSLEGVTVASVKNNCVLNDVDYIASIKYASNELREYIMQVAKLIEEKSVAVVSSALEYKPFEIAVLGDSDGEVYKYLDTLGYDTYSNIEPSNNDYLVDEFNVKTNAKLLVVAVNTAEDLEKLTHNVVIKEYINALNIQSVKPGSLVFVSSIGSKDIKKVFAEATVLDADNKNLLFDIEAIAKTCVREISSSVDTVKSSKPTTKETRFNTAGFAGLFRGLGIAGLAIMLVEFILYTFIGAHYLVLGIGLGVATLLMIGAFVIAILLYVKGKSSAMYMLACVFSGILVLSGIMGVSSVCITRGSSEWCYQGFWYEQGEDQSISITNVDFYYTFLHRNVVIPETIMSNPVTHFTIENHAEVYAISSVSENLQSLTVINCDSLKEISISVMSMEDNAVSIEGCKNLKNLAIKNADVLSLELKDLEKLNGFVLKGVAELNKLYLDNIGLDEMWLSEELTKLTNFDIKNIDSLKIYVLNKHEGNIRAALTHQSKTKWIGNGYRHPNDDETTSKLYSCYVYPNTNN